MQPEDPPRPTPRQPGTPRRYTLRKRHRLSHDLDYKAVFDARVRKHRGPITVFAKPNHLGHHRLGLSIGRRVGNAVKRNALKRRIREAFRLHRHQLPGSYDLVVTARPHHPEPLTWYEHAIVNLTTKLHAAWQRQSSNE